MNKKLLLISLVVGVFLISAIILSQENKFNAGVGKTSIAVPGQAFHGDSFFQDYQYNMTGGYLTGGGEILYAPIYFSPGYKKVNKIIFKFYDNNDDADLSVGLYRKNFITDAFEFVAVVRSGFSFNSANIEAKETNVSGPLARINNDLYSWCLMCEFDSIGGEPLELHQVIIKYSK
ncbi:hypothetical protein ACFLRM_05330 [Acidobacteriota bacterium]